MVANGKWSAKEGVKTEGAGQCWASYFVKVTSYILHVLLATELFSYSYILLIK